MALEATQSAQEPEAAVQAPDPLAWQEARVPLQAHGGQQQRVNDLQLQRLSRSKEGRINVVHHLPESLCMKI